MPSIFNMFGRSPIKPLQEHMSVVEKCASTLEPFFDAVLTGDWARAGDLRVAIARLENEADEIKRDVRLHLPKSMFTSVARGDVLALVGLQDLIANKAKDIAGVIYGRQMCFPETIIDAFKAYLSRSIEATSQARQAIHELDELQETVFSGNEIKIIEHMIKELAVIEHDTDELQIDLRASVFQIESTLPPVDVMFLYKVIEWVGMLADLAQNVGDRLQLLLSK